MSGIGHVHFKPLQTRLSGIQYFDSFITHTLQQCDVMEFTRSEVVMSHEVDAIDTRMAIKTTTIEVDERHAERLIQGYVSGELSASMSQLARWQKLMEYGNVTSVEYEPQAEGEPVTDV